MPIAPPPFFLVSVMAGNKSNKNKKYDRNRPRCQAYRTGMKREMSKLRKLARHLARHGFWDSEAQKPASPPADAKAAWDALMAKLPNDKIKLVLRGTH